MRVALCQMTVAGDKQLNIKRASSFIREASAAGAQLVVLPEMWNCPYSVSLETLVEQGAAQPSRVTYCFRNPSYVFARKRHPELPLMQNESFPEYAEDLEGGAAPSAQALANLARDFQITLVGGSIPERCKVIARRSFPRQAGTL